MSETRTVDGYPIYTGSLTCPSPDVCDRGKWEKHEKYVERHCADHGLDLSFSDDARRNLGLNCFYYFHKYLWENPTLAPQPHWEIHSFISEWDRWNEKSTEQDKPIGARMFALPPAAERGTGEYRRFKQIEVPRQCQKTSIGARAYAVFRSLREYFVVGRINYRIIIRSATGKNTRDTLAVIRRMSGHSQNLRDLYGVWIGRCYACARTSQNFEPFTHCRFEDCGRALNRKSRRIALINDTAGMGADQVQFRWLTEAENADAVAAYSIWVAGLRTETTGQRPDLYIWDDPQTDTNSDNPTKRAKITEAFDESIRQLEIPGEAIVLDTRKYADDFAGNIQKKPLSTLFYTLHRRVRWKTDEPEAAPYVVGGYRYYYPIKGNGDPALSAQEVERLERQMVERKFSAEYMNDPLDPTKVLFRRDQFKIIAPREAPFEITCGLGSTITEQQQRELDAMNLKVFALNSCDPASKEEQSVRGDDSFIVGLRVDRYGAIYITRLSAGKWSASRTWDEIFEANNYNRPEFTDYELPADEKHVRPSHEKWIREKSEALSSIEKKPVPLFIPMRWQHMPKSGKSSRIEQMEMWTKNGRFFILSNAASSDLIDKYIEQWVGYGVVDHDDGPDATSRLIRWLVATTYQQPSAQPEEPSISATAGVASVPLALIEEMSFQEPAGKLWGETGW